MGLQQGRLWVVLDGVWYKGREQQEKKINHLEESHWWEKPAQLMWEVQLGKLLLCRDSLHAGHCPWNKTACPSNLCLNGLIFTMTFQPCKHPCRQHTHANTGGKKTLENKYSSIYFPIRGKTTQRARKPALFQGSPGPADVPRAAEKSVCGKGQCLHYTPRLLPPHHVHLSGRQKGDGSGAQGSKVALENCDSTRIHLSVCI